MELSGSDIFRRHTAFYYTDKDRIGPIFLYDISVFEYILALKLGYIKFTDAIADYSVYRSEHGAPAAVYRYNETTTRGMTDIDILSDISSMIDSFPVYGEAFFNHSMDGRRFDILQLSVFEYGPDYDMCTMPYNAYDLLVRIVESCDECNHNKDGLEYMERTSEIAYARHRREKYYTMDCASTALYRFAYRSLLDTGCTEKGYSGDGIVVVSEADRMVSRDSHWGYSNIKFISCDTQHNKKEVVVAYGLDWRTQRGKR